MGWLARLCPVLREPWHLWCLETDYSDMFLPIALRPFPPRSGGGHAMGTAVLVLMNTDHWGWRTWTWHTQALAHLFPPVPGPAGSSFQGTDRLLGWRSPTGGRQSSTRHFQSCIALRGRKWSEPGESAGQEDKGSALSVTCMLARLSLQRNVTSASILGTCVNSMPSNVKN